MADETYIDKNGGRWTIIAAPNGQFLATADVPDPLSRVGRFYSPHPPDFDGPTKQLVIGQVELYATAHRNDIGLVVNASADSPSSPQRTSGWVVLLLIIAAAWKLDNGQRRKR